MKNKSSISDELLKRIEPGTYATHLVRLMVNGEYAKLSNNLELSNTKDQTALHDFVRAIAELRCGLTVEHIEAALKGVSHKQSSTYRTFGTARDYLAGVVVCACDDSYGMPVDICMRLWHYLIDNRLLISDSHLPVGVHKLWRHTVHMDNTVPTGKASVSCNGKLFSHSSVLTKMNAHIPVIRQRVDTELVVKCCASVLVRNHDFVSTMRDTTYDEYIAAYSITTMRYTNERALTLEEYDAVADYFKLTQ